MWSFRHPHVDASNETSKAAPPAALNVDARLTKCVAVGRRGKMDLVLDVFNLLNRTNVIAVDSYLPRVAARDLCLAKIVSVTVEE